MTNQQFIEEVKKNPEKVSGLMLPPDTEIEDIFKVGDFILKEILRIFFKNDEEIENVIRNWETVYFSFEEWLSICKKSLESPVFEKNLLLIREIERANAKL